MQTKYSEAFAETLFIIKCLPNNEQNKISKKFIKFLNENKNDNYVITINPNINLLNQKLLDETKALLREIYLAYFTSDREKTRILKFDNYRDIIEADLKNRKYDNDIFKDNVKNINNMQIVEYKEESTFKKIIDRIQYILNNIF